MTQQGQDVCYVERGTGSGSLWLGEGSPLVHRRITGSIQGVPWIASGSPWGAEGEHYWIISLCKTINNSPRYGCRAPYDVDKRRRLIRGEVDQSELNSDVERSGVDHFDPGCGLCEPNSLRGDPYLEPWVSEVIRFGL